ncbi:MAG: hypothetical protein RL189_2708 [Pseudomonadota bacterium]|jgi:hypothetical protein
MRIIPAFIFMMTVVACSPQRTEQKANISGTGPMGGSLGSLGFCESYKTSQPDFQTIATQGDSEEDGQLKPDSGYTMKRLAAEFMTAANLYCGGNSPKQATEFKEKICEPISNASLLDRSIAKLRTARLKRPFLMRDERWEAEKKAMIESEARKFSQTYLLMYAECEGESLLKTK